MARTETKKNSESLPRKSAGPRRAFQDIMPKGGSVSVKPIVERDPASSPFFRNIKDTKEERVDSEYGAHEDFVREHHFRPSRKRRFAFIGFLGVVVAVAAGLFFLLPSASVSLALKKTTVPFSVNIAVSTATLSPKISGGTVSLPGELLTVKKNADVPISATTTEKVEVRATGKLTIVNAFNTQPQTLVEKTRFVSPEGKTFRLVKRTVVPGASMKGTTVVPSSIEAQVVADGAGESYNVPASKGWKIPGFSGTPKYDKFYADALDAMTGGFSGTRAVAGTGDIERGKRDLTEVLEGASEGELSILMKESFKLFGEAKVFKLGSVDTRPDPSTPGSFRLFGEGILRAVVFDEPALLASLGENLKPTNGTNLIISTTTLSYGKPSVDAEKGTISVTATGTITFEESFDQNMFKEKILGASEDEVRKMVSAIPGVDRASISLDPFWVSSVPTRSGRVTVTVE